MCPLLPLGGTYAGLSSTCNQARCRIADPAWPPRRIPAKYYHVGLYPSRCISAGPDDGIREVMADGDKKSGNQRVRVLDPFLRRGGILRLLFVPSEIPGRLGSTTKRLPVERLPIEGQTRLTRSVPLAPVITRGPIS